MLQMFNQDPRFFQYYVETFANRFTKNCYSSLLYYLTYEMRKDGVGPTLNEQNLQTLEMNALVSNTDAIKYLYNEDIGKLYPHHVINVAKFVNENENGSSGFRKTDVVIIREAAFQPASPRSIPERMNSLFDNYHNVWDNLDPFSREAHLHLSLTRMQPFEDGNKRTAQIISGYNLIRAGYAPILIKQEEREEYVNYILNNDLEGMTNFFQTSSARESEYISKLYINYCERREIKKNR